MIIKVAHCRPAQVAEELLAALPKGITSRRTYNTVTQVTYLYMSLCISQFAHHLQYRFVYTNI
jgi:hypothetical protein